MPVKSPLLTKPQARQPASASAVNQIHADICWLHYRMAQIQDRMDAYLTGIGLYVAMFGVVIDPFSETSEGTTDHA